MRLFARTLRLFAVATVAVGMAACGAGSPTPAATSTPAAPAGAAPASSPTPPATSPARTDDEMRAECRTRAAAQYGTSESATAVRGAPGPVGGTDAGPGVAFALPGTVDKGPEGTKTFLCRYAADRTLIDVMATTSDGE